MAIKYYEYCENKAWVHVKPGWHETSVKYSENYSAQHRNVVNWLYEKIDSPEKHARWLVDDSEDVVEGRFKFRHERDYIHFTLRWS